MLYVSEPSDATSALIYARNINALDATKNVAQSINYEIKQKQNEFLSKILARHLKIAS